MCGNNCCHTLHVLFSTVVEGVLHHTFFCGNKINSLIIICQTLGEDLHVARRLFLNFEKSVIVFLFYSSHLEANFCPLTLGSFCKRNLLLMHLGGEA